MKRSLSAAAAPIIVAAIMGCGGGSSPPTDPAAAKAPQPATPTPPVAPPAPTADAPPADKHSAAEAAPHDDPNEKEGAIELTPLVDTKGAKVTWPKQTVGDHDCLKELSFTGQHKTDFSTLITKCGTPTGMVEYTKPAEGRLHAKHDKRDEFKLKVQKGMCYRYFAVADDGIKDIDIIVLKRGALLAMDKSQQAVAVIDTEKLWCVDEDMDLQFNIEIDGRGAGGYTFGVWTRPNQKK